MKKFLFIYLSFILLLSKTSPLLAKDIPMELSLDKDVVELEAGDVLQLGLTFNNTQDIPSPQLPEIEGFKSQYLGPSTMMSMVNGRVSSSITHRYILMPVKIGKFTIGPFSFSSGGDTYKSQAKEAKVVSRGQAVKQKTIPFGFATELSEETEKQLNERIFLILSAEKTKAYLNERIPVTIKLYVQQLAVRDIQYPNLEEQGYIKETFSQPKQYQEELGGVSYDCIEFKTNIYATREGQITLGPAKIKCNIVARKKERRRGFGLNDFFDHELFDDSFFDDFFSRFQVFPMDLKSAPLNLNIFPFPDAAKPQEFSGALGQFKMKVSISPQEVKVGDPITLKMEVSGEGNLDSINSPLLSSKEGFKTYQPEIQKNGNTKTFQQVIIPQSEKITQVPEIKFSYFDPEKKEYILLKQSPLPIKVLPTEEKEAKIIDATPQEKTPRLSETKIVGRDIVYIKEETGRLRKKGEIFYQKRLFLSLQFLPMVYLFFIFLRKKRKERLRTDLRYARMLRAPKVARAGLKNARDYFKNNKKEEFYNVIFKTTQEYLGHRFGRPAAGITVDVVDQLLVGGDLSKEIAEKLKRCFSECDIARYAAAALDKEKMIKTLEVLEEIIDYLERRKR